jgi:hypothetical protein
MGACVVAAALVLPRIAAAGEGEELEAAKARINAGNYTEAEARLRKMLDPSAPPCPVSPDLTPEGCRLTERELVQKARGYYAVALVANGKNDEARGPVDDILLDDPYYSASPTDFPPPVIDLFIEERSRRAKDIADVIAKKNADEAKTRADAEAHEKELKAYIGALEAQASKQLVTEKRSRWIAAIPFGVGQFQNGNVGLGVVFAVTEGLAATTLGVTTAATIHLANDGVASGATPEPTQFTSLHIVNDVSFGVLIALAIGGIIEAETSFSQPAPAVVPRALPPKPRFLVTGVPGAKDATGIGLKVIF